MESKYQNGLINNNEDEEMNNYTNYTISKKIQANKWKIINIGISLILFCLIIILLCQVFNKNETSPQIQSSSSYLNDPYFKKYSVILPLTLKENKEGKIEMENCMFEAITSDKITFKKESSYSLKKVEVDQELNSSDNSDFLISIDTSFYYDTKFKRKTQEVKDYTNKKFLFGGKYNICSLSAKKENIVFSETFLNKIKHLAENDLTDAEKAKELDKMFKDYGYYIPLKINIGGYFYKDINNYEDNENINALLDFRENSFMNANGSDNSKLENYIDNLFYNKNLVIKGGDIFKDNFEDWKSSINFNNSEIIEYCNIITITNLLHDILDKKTKNLLEIPLSLVDEKYIKREKYFTYIKTVKEFVNYGNITGYDSKRNGITQINNLIYSEYIDIKDDKILDYTYPDLIVGWKINSLWQDGTNGEFTMTDPILTKRVKATFKSRLFRNLHFSLEIFFLKYPE
jgi:hypothetical protein